MRYAIGVLAAGAALAALLSGADPAPCRLGKGLYDDRLALVQKQAQGGAPAAVGLLAPGAPAPANKLGEIDAEYHRFLAEVSADAARRDSAALSSCCEQAAGDRAGGLFCQLSAYLVSGRVDAGMFLELFPTNRKDTLMLWDLDAIAGDAGKALYPPNGPTRRLIDELFLLVMDERDAAMTKYFNLAAHASGETAKYMDGQIVTFLKEAPSAVINQWLTLRRYRPKLKSAAQSLAATTPPAEMQKLLKTVHAFCDKSNPDCPDIYKLYAGK